MIVIYVAIFFNFTQIVLQITVSVWEAMSEENIVISMFESMSKCERVICPKEATLVTFVLILIIIDI